MKRILVVDDEYEIRSMLQEFLILQNFDVKTAADGFEALQVFADFDPDLAIVDIKMPNMDGPSFSKKILEKNPTFPIIIITGFAAQYYIDEILDIGVKKIMQKPLTINALYEAIQEFIS